MIPRYECELCGSVYRTVEAAQFCETFRPLEACHVAVGDHVSFPTRYDGTESDVVVAIKLKPDTYQPGNLSQWESEPDGLEQYRKKMELLPDLVMHMWVLELTDEHQFGKERFSKYVDADAVSKAEVATASAQPD